MLPSFRLIRVDCRGAFGTFLALIVGACVYLFALSLPSTAQDQPLLHYSIVGSSSCSTKPCFNGVMANLRVQQSLLKLAHEPLRAESLETALKGSGISARDLVSLRLIRLEGNQYFLNFPLFTADDVKQIRSVAERYAGSLADAVLAHRTEIDSALKMYDAPGVDGKAVAYFVLGCASLDWDGLNITAAKGYRKETEDRPDGKYVPDAEEITTQSLDRIYWGSHNDGYDGITVTSFGDHASKRYSLPDLLWQLPERASTQNYPEDLQPAIQGLVKASITQTGTTLAHMMISLRETDKSAAELAQSTGLQQGQAEQFIGLLLALQLVSERNGRYIALVPVLTKRDEVMTKRLLGIGSHVMNDWLPQNYPKMKSELQSLSFTRSGVPFEDGFTMIWHYLFGIANRHLVEAGLFADPYAPDRKYKGSITVVSELDLP